MIARSHEVDLIDSWRADSQGLSMARSRNYPMCENSISSEAARMIFLGSLKIDPTSDSHDLNRGPREDSFYGFSTSPRFYTAKTHFGHAANCLVSAMRVNRRAPSSVTLPCGLVRRRRDQSFSSPSIRLSLWRYGR